MTARHLLPWPDRARLAARTTVRDLARCTLAVAALLVAATVVPAAAGWRSYVVLSGSMAPRLWPGDVVVASPGRPSVHRIVVFGDPLTPGRTLVHRVVAVGPDGTLTTRGDANPSPDPAPVRHVDGVARLRVPFIGLPDYWLHAHAWGPLGGCAAGLAALVFLTGLKPGRATPPKRGRSRREPR